MSMRVSLVAVVALLIALPAWAADDAKKPDTREAEKVTRPDETDAEEADPRDDLRGIVEEAEGKVEKILDEMSENMRQIDELLKGKDTGQQTQARQQQVMKQLDQLIDEASKT